MSFLSAVGPVVSSMVQNPAILQSAAISGALGIGAALVSDKTSFSNKAYILVAFVAAGVALTLFGTAFGLSSAVCLAIGGLIGRVAAGPLPADDSKVVKNVIAGMIIGAAVGYTLGLIPLEGYAYPVKIV